MQDQSKQAAAVGDADVQKKITELIQIEGLMEPNENILGNLQCNNPKLVLSNEDYRTYIPISEGEYYDIVSSYVLNF